MAGTAQRLAESGRPGTGISRPGTTWPLSSYEELRESGHGRLHDRVEVRATAQPTAELGDATGIQPVADPGGKLQVRRRHPGRDDVDVDAEPVEDRASAVGPLVVEVEPVLVVDPSNEQERSALAAHVRQVAHLLVTHAEHEDGHVQPMLELHLPALAEQVENDHHRLDAGIAGLATQADDTLTSSANTRWHAHRLYLELASFTSSYLAHQDLEERVIMPAIEEAIGTEATLGIHMAIVGSIPPDEMAASLAVMLPAMNVDDRAELLGGMQAGAPAEVFDGIWSLAGSVLDPRDHDALAARLGRS